MDDDRSSSPASYVRLVQHLIEKCICYNLKKEECMQTLETHANIKPVITSIVWKELEKVNQEFFETYNKDRGQEPTTHCKNPSGEQASAASKRSQTTAATKDRGQEPTQKNPSDEHASASKRSQMTTTTTTKDRGEEPTQKNPSDKQPSASKRSDDDGN